MVKPSRLVIKKFPYAIMIWLKPACFWDDFLISVDIKRWLFVIHLWLPQYKVPFHIADLPFVVSMCLSCTEKCMPLLKKGLYFCVLVPCEKAEVLSNKTIMNSEVIILIQTSVNFDKVNTNLSVIRVFTKCEEVTEQ